ncbi:uncharacterized protein [Dendropsophus ebraccatus]|uniref:uncharacterized protein n=1 Tax=Dendropsophus ebraccatus TaxID=150705 RepID=UPI003831B706
MDLVSLLLSLIVFILLVSVLNSKKDNKYHNFPPGPKPLPIIGHMHLLDVLKPHKSFLELSKKYGPVFTVQVGQLKMVILCGYETVKDALMNYGEEFSGRLDTPVVKKTFDGYGVIFSHGDNWKAMRKFTLSTLRDFGMGRKTIENKISEECENLMEAFRSYGGKPFDNQNLINMAVANIIVSILLDDRFEYDDPTILKLMSLNNENIRILENPMVKLYNSYPTLVGWLPGSHRKLTENFRKIQDFMKATFLDQTREFDIDNPRSFIEAFLAKQQEGTSESELYFHNKNLIMLVIDLFSAGMETTSTTLRWGLLLMMKYPEVQKKVKNEIESVIGSAQPQAEHRKQMPYTDAVIHEIQRFGDIIPGNLPHSAIRDTTFRGYSIPKGTIIIPVLHSVLKDGTCFEKPEEFYPEHFLDSNGNFRKNEAFIPFSLGKRSCAGENLAKMELFLFFTTLLQNFSFWAPPGTELDLTPAVGFTNAPLPHEICAIPRRYSTIMLGPAFITIVLLVIIFLFFTKVFYNQKENKYKNFPPGPKCLPIIGNLHIFDIKDPSKTFTQLSNKYGPVFSIQLGMQKVIVLYGYDAVKDAFVNHAEEFTDRADIPIFKETSKGHGIVFSNGENWKVMRRFTISTLKDFGMGKKSLEDRINEESDCLVQMFKSYGGKPFENTAIINTAVSNVIVSILLGHRYDYGDPTILKLMSLVNENFKLLGSPMIMLYNTYPNLIRWLPGGHRTVFKNNTALQDFIIEKFTKQKNQLDVNHQRNLIDVFLIKQLENNAESDQYFHNDNLTALVSNLFVAGMETTSTTLRWAILLMMKYPEIQKNVQKEIDQVIGLRQPQMEHCKHMPYTDAVIHEIQRFGNIIPAIAPHAATQDVMFRGYFIPKGTHVLPILTSVLKDKNYFQKPDEFYPEHFLSSQGHFVKNEAFLPFSAGKRRCAGEILAKAELFIFFTKLLQNFTFQAPPAIEVDITPVVGFTNAPMIHDICAVPRHSD